MSQAPKPIAEGNLERTPLAHVLVHIHRNRLQGTLALWPDPHESMSGQDRILFRAGAPIAGRFLRPASSMERGLLDLFTRRASPYAFYEADLVGSGSAVVEGAVAPLGIVAASLRGNAREEIIEGVLSRYGSHLLRYARGVALDDLGLTSNERAFVDLLRAAPATVAELSRVFGDERTARHVLYLLAVTQSLEIFEAPQIAGRAVEKGPARALRQEDTPDRPDASARTDSAEHGTGSDPAPKRPSIQSVPGVTTRSVSAAPHSRPKPRGTEPPRAPDAPPHLTAELQARWQVIANRANAIERENYFQMLGVERSAGSSTVESAYIDLVKEWHPDRLPPELSELRSFVERVFGYMTEAKRALSEGESRREYLKVLQQGGGTPEAQRKLNDIVKAALEFQKVEVLVRRREWEEAETRLADVRESNPEDADYIAMEAFIILQRAGTDAAMLKDVLNRCAIALRKDDSIERAHFTRALALKRLKRDSEAVRSFRRVTELNPRNIDAMREVRLAEMRKRGKSSPTPTGSGERSGPKTDSLISRLFGGSQPKKKP